MAIVQIDPYIVEGDGTLNKGLTLNSIILFDASSNDGTNFQWEVISKPEDSNALIQAPVDSKTRFGPLDRVGVYQIRLWIDRETGDQRSKTIAISVPGSISPEPLPDEPLFEAGGGRIRNWSFELPGLYPGRADGWQIIDEANILNAHAGITRGRCIPTNFNPESGKYTMVLGDDISLDDDFPIDAKFEVSQVVDLTNIQSLEFDSRFKIPPTVSGLLSANLEAYYKLDGNANDATPNGRNGVPTGINWVPGKLAQCAKYFDVGDKIVAAKWKGVTGTNARSISFWINIDSPLPIDNNNAIFHWGANAPTSLWRSRIPNLGGSTGKIEISNAIAARTGNTDITDQAWHHVVVTFPALGDLDSVKIYVDNSEDVPYTDAGVVRGINTGVVFDVTIGYDPIGLKSIRDSYLDEIGIWSTELSAAQVGILWNGGAGISYD